MCPRMSQLVVVTYDPNFSKNFFKYFKNYQNNLKIPMTRAKLCF